MSASRAVPAAGPVAEPLRPSVLVSSDGVVEMAHRRLMPQLSRPGFVMDDLFVKSFAAYERLYHQALAREAASSAVRRGARWPAGPVPFLLTERVLEPGVLEVGVSPEQRADVAALLAVIR